MIKIYIAGKVEPRDDLPVLGGVEWLNPYVEGLTDDDVAVYVPRDLLLLRKSDVVLAFLTTGQERNTCAEIGVAYARGVPVIAVCPLPLRRMYGLTLALCSAVVEDGDTVYTEVMARLV